MKRLSLFLTIVAVLGMTTGARADAPPQPTGEIILTVSGDIVETNSDDGAAFDLEMLRALPQVKFTTKTQWTEGDVEFTGVSLQALLTRLGAKGATISAIALNDYKVEIPAASLDAEAPIIAYFMNGKTMSPRGKGPLWIVYPYDADPGYRTETIYSRSIWQLDQLVSAD